MARSKKAELNISFLLDRTGSMSTVKNDVIGGFNTFLAQQKKEGIKTRFTLTLFDSVSIDTQTFESIDDVPALTEDTYIPRSMTPLLDAMGRVIQEVDALPPAKRTLLVVYTDGLENASREFTKKQVQNLVEEKKAKGWDFIFLGADIDAYSEGGQLAVAAANTVGVTGQSTGATFAALGQTVASYSHGDEKYMKALKAEEKKQKKQTKK